MTHTSGWEGLPQFSKDMYQERYFLKGEDYIDWTARMSRFADNPEMATRIRTYISNYWFHPSTPISSNGHAPQRGLPISCYVNQVEDNKLGIFNKFTENNWLGAEGGGIGTSWSNVREIGCKVGENGESSGIIPFIKVSDSSTLAVSQGGLRRASQAVYLDISHPEIEEFIDVRRPTGDANRRSLNVHHGVVLCDSFMRAVAQRQSWALLSPKDNKVVKTVDAFDLYKKILVTRMETGEPYMLFGDTVNDMAPIEYKNHNMKVSMSNLCAEMTLATDTDYTGVCCLGSINLEYYDEYVDEFEQFLYDCNRFLDNVLTSFIELTEGKEGFANARRSAMNERSIGLGVMGFAGLLQKKNLPWDSPMTKGLNTKIFAGFKYYNDLANVRSAREFGTCPISATRRNTHSSAIAPTASISTLCNGSSQGIDPRIGNSYVHKTNIGTYTQRNVYLEKLLSDIGKNTPEVWKSITKNEGSIQHLEFLSDYEKDVFLTAYELPQAAIIDLAGDRAPYIDLGQSVNLFIRSDEHVENVYNIHMRAWKKRLKSLYYCRSTSAVRASAGTMERKVINYDDCLSCQ